MPANGRLRRLLVGYIELITVLAGAALGLGARRPFAWLADHQGINVLLAVLVFATAFGVAPKEFAQLRHRWRPMAGALMAGSVLLPVLVWLASRVVAPGDLRGGVLAIGVVPCEIASVATTAMAGGDVAAAAGLLVGSTALCVALAGPVLALEAGGAHVDLSGIVVDLLLVVALPLAVGLVCRAKLAATERAGRVERAERAAGAVAIASVAALIALIAAGTHLSTAYLRVAGALAVLLVLSGLLGMALGARAPREMARTLLLTTSMRDFAIAAAVATDAFGRSAAAPLGLYGILVLVWGTGAAGFLRRRGGGPAPPLPA